MKCLKITVSGVVQGVGYRYFCYRKAVEYNINGYARNLFNGDVEIVAEGEEKFIKNFISELNIGPRHASVKSVRTMEIESKKEYSEFSIL